MEHNQHQYRILREMRQLFATEKLKIKSWRREIAKWVADFSALKTGRRSFDDDDYEYGLTLTLGTAQGR